MEHLARPVATVRRSEPGGFIGHPRLAPGMVAHVVVFDPGTISERATVHDPFALALGMLHVLVAGEPILRDGVSTGRRPGRVLRRLPHGRS